MKIKISPQILLAFFILAVPGCNSDKQTKDNTKETNQSKVERDETVSSITAKVAVLEAPDFTDPGLRQYYKDYSAYLVQVVTTIRNKDEAQTIKLFREEGKKFNNINEKPGVCLKKNKSSPPGLCNHIRIKKKLFNPIIIKTLKKKIENNENNNSCIYALSFDKRRL